MTPRARAVVVLAVLLASPGLAQEVSPPQSVTLSVYDVGFALVSELRRVTLPGGDTELVIRDLPSGLDAASASLAPVGSAGDLVLGEKRFEHDLATRFGLLDRYRGREVAMTTGAGTTRGALVGAPHEGRPDLPIVIDTATGAEAVFGLDEVRSMLFPNARQGAFTSPSLLWRVTASRGGPQQVRLSYLAEGLTWEAFHDITLLPEGNAAHVSSRVWLNNRSGGRYADARVRLVTTEKGLRDPVVGPAAGAAPAKRYAYGTTTPAFERVIAGFAPQAVQDLPVTVTLNPGASAYFTLADARSVPVSTFYVYDGVRFDRFQRNRRNDWNFGTESHQDVETHIEFDNAAGAGLGVALPSGRLRLYRLGADESIDLLGEDQLVGSLPGAKVSARIGPSRGLRGERERTGYTEVKPLHEYEESFQIRLENTTGADAEIRVVEHLYRWPDFEIVRADTEYTKTAAQTIEFRPQVKAGGTRSVNYTVRYRW